MSEKLDAPSTSSIDTGSGGPVGGNGAGTHKAIIKNVDMSEEMQRESIEIALIALEKYTIEKDIAAQIKKDFDRRHGPTWHVVVGKNFGSYVTHGMSFIVCSIYSCSTHNILFSTRD
jgi:dynein light chain LC8-type